MELSADSGWLGSAAVQTGYQYEDPLAEPQTSRLTEESFKDLGRFLSFSRETESLHEIPRLVRDLVAALLQEHCGLNSGLLCGRSKFVEH